MAYKLSKDPVALMYVADEDTVNGNHEHGAGGEGYLTSSKENGTTPLDRTRFKAVSGSGNATVRVAVTPPMTRAPSNRSDHPGSLLDDDSDFDYAAHYKALEPLRRSDRGYDRGHDRGYDHEQSMEPVSYSASSRDQDASSFDNVDTGKLPEWESKFFMKFGNKMRLGNSGILVLGHLPA